MTTEITASERRRHKRFMIKDKAFAADSTRMGQIVDLSMGGLSFNYPELHKKPKKASAIDIFVRDNGFFLSDLPVTMVSDNKMADGDLDPPIPALRRRRVRFEELNQEQKFQLEYFLWTHHK